jgi:hypothetical protein
VEWFDALLVRLDIWWKSLSPETRWKIIAGVLLVLAIL